MRLFIEYLSLLWRGSWICISRMLLCCSVVLIHLHMIL